MPSRHDSTQQQAARIAGWSLLVLILGTVAMRIFPQSGSVVSPGFIIPDFPAELTLAIWLIVKAVRLPASDSPG